MRLYLPHVTASATHHSVTTHPGDWLWLGWVLAFVVIELALYVWRGTPATLSGLLWRWLDNGPGGDGTRARRCRWLVLAGALAVLAYHLLGGARW